MGTRDLVRQLDSAHIPAAGVYTSINEIGDELCNLDYVQLHFDHDSAAIDKIRAKSDAKIISVVDGEIPGAIEKIGLYRKSGSDIVLVEFRSGAVRHINVIESMQQTAKIGVAGKIAPEDVRVLLSFPLTLIDSSSRLERSIGIKDSSLVLRFIGAVSS